MGAKKVRAEELGLANKSRERGCADVGSTKEMAVGTARTNLGWSHPSRFVGASPPFDAPEAAGCP